MEYKKALLIAQEILSRLAPHCERIVIAGSIRRQKAQVKDVEIVCIPKYEAPDTSNDLFGGEGRTDVLPVVCRGFMQAVNQWKKVKGEPNGKYTQRIVPLPVRGAEGAGEQGSIALDLFIPNPDNFGYILMLRTGSSEWNQRVMLHRMKGNGYKMNEGHIFWKGAMVPVPDEEEMFRRMGMSYVEPQNRK